MLEKSRHPPFFRHPRSDVRSPIRNSAMGGDLRIATPRPIRRSPNRRFHLLTATPRGLRPRLRLRATEATKHSWPISVSASPFACALRAGIETGPYIDSPQLPHLRWVAISESPPQDQSGDFRIAVFIYLPPPLVAFGHGSGCVQPKQPSIVGRSPSRPVPSPVLSGPG